MRSVKFLPLFAAALTIKAEYASLLTDINKISMYWGQLRPYTENTHDAFGVEYGGLPEGCQVESAHTLQRHAERFPTRGQLDGMNIDRFSQLVTNFTSESHPDDPFTGPLSFLNSWKPIHTSEGLLTGIGANTMLAAGVSFWNQYGRTLYNASVGQLAYDPNFPNGTARPPIILRTTEQSRIHNSQINWALGFFGSTAQKAPNPSLDNVSKPFDVVVIPEEENVKYNNTLATKNNCPGAAKPELHSIGTTLLSRYISVYLSSATKRLQIFAPTSFKLGVDDTYAMQALCAYEYAFIGNSEFCGFFTEDEWAGYSNSLDIKYYYEHSFGSPLGRPFGIGYVEELLARLNHSLITSSSSSLNSTLDSNPATFPTDQPFYADFSHNSILVAVLTALSLDYFHEPPSYTQYPPNPDRKFTLSKITPFGARIITETIGCNSPNPTPKKSARVQYSPSQYGYNASTASHKFIRMRLNNGIIPLSTIRGGACGNEETGRIDGLCALEDFLLSQKNASALANYQQACFGDNTVENSPSGKDYDGRLS